MKEKQNTYEQEINELVSTAQGMTSEQLMAAILLLRQLLETEDF